MTWKPAPNMTKKQIKKELERQAVLFEEKCRTGMFLDGNIKLSEFAEKWLADYGQKQLKAETYYTYTIMLKRINAALGHLRIDRIQPHHLLEFYNNLSETGIREDIKYKSTKDFRQIIKSKNITQKALAEKAGVSISTIKSCINSKNISKKSADKISDALNDNSIFAPCDINKRLSGETILHYHRFLSSMLSTAVEWQLILSNPCDRVKAPKAERKEANYLDEYQAKELIKCLEKEPLRYRTIIMLLLYSGMRRGELCGLEWNDIDFKHNIINISKSNLYLPGKGIFEDSTKNKTSERVIQIPHEMTKLLIEYKKEQNKTRLLIGDQWNECDKVFTTKNGSPIHPDTITSWFHKFIEKNNLPNIHIHSLRHTNATLLIAGGANIRTVAKRLGHATPSTTSNIYAHAIRSADELAAKKLADILNPIKENI